MNIMKRLFFFISVFALSLTYFACSKQNSEEVITPDNIKQAVHSQNEAVKPDNFDNIWDTVGFLHNQALFYVKAHATASTPALERIVIGEHYVSELLGVQEITFVSNEDVLRVLADSASGYKNTIHTSSFSEQGKIKVEELFSLLYNIAAASHDSYTSIKEPILAFENEVLLSNLSKTDKDGILKLTSIARHSLYFWYQEYKTKENNGSSTQRGLWKWLAVGIADVAGGIAGAITTGPTLVGSIAGAIAGSVGASSGASALVDWITQ
jgi:hypothetical protein